MRPTIKTLTTDWIQLTCEGVINLDWTDEFTEISKSVVLEKTKYSNSNFTTICKVYFEGREFGEIQFNPTNEVINPHSVIFKLKTLKNTYVITCGD